MGRELLDTAGRHGTRHTRFGRRIVIDQRQSSASAVEKDLSGQNRVRFCLFVNSLVAQTSFLSKHSMWLCARIWVKNPPQPKDGEGSLFFHFSHSVWSCPKCSISGTMCYMCASYCRLHCGARRRACVAKICCRANVTKLAIFWFTVKKPLSSVAMCNVWLSSCEDIERAV